jgi:seryl-tRNA synthetase
MVRTGLVIGLLAVAGLCFAAEQPGVTKEDVQRDAAQAMEKAKVYAEQQKQEYTKQIQAKMDDVSKKIDELKDKAKDAKGEALTKIEEAMAALKPKQDAAKKQLQELGSSTSAAWEQVKGGADKAVNELQKAYEDAAKYFK